MSSEDYISYVKTFLKKHECPLLNFMPLEEVFDATNMSVLVSWAFCLWHKDRFETKLVNRAYDKAFIAELIDCFGFCSDLEEAQRFLNAEQTPEEQVNMAKLLQIAINNMLTLWKMCCSTINVI